MHYVKRGADGGYYVHKPDNLPATGQRHADFQSAQTEKEKLDHDTAYKHVPPGLSDSSTAVGYQT